MAIGRDKILGLGADSFLSNSLINASSQKQVSVLAQAWRPHEQDYNITSWYSSVELELIGSLTVEWDHYRRELQASGVSIFDSAEELIWNRKDSSRDLSTKNVYASIICIMCINLLHTHYQPKYLNDSIVISMTQYSTNPLGGEEGRLTTHVG